MTVPTATIPAVPATPATPAATVVTPATSVVTPATPATSTALTPEQAVKAVEASTVPVTPATPPPATPPPAAPTTPAPMTPEQFSALAESEREKWQAQQAAKQATARVAELEAKVGTWVDDPYTAFEAAGGNLDTYTQRLIDGGQAGPKDDIARLEKTVADQQAQLSQLAEAGKKTAKTSYYSDFAVEVKTVVDTNPDYQETRDAIEAVEAVRGSRFDIVDDITPHMESHHAQTGKQLTPAEIAGMMRNRATSMAERIRNSPAIRRIMGLSEPTPPPPPPGTPAPAQPPSTLTSSLETASPPEDLSALPHSERVKRAAARLEKPHWSDGR